MERTEYSAPEAICQLVSSACPGYGYDFVLRLVGVVGQAGIDEVRGVISGVVPTPEFDRRLRLAYALYAAQRLGGLDKGRAYAWFHIAHPDLAGLSPIRFFDRGDLAALDVIAAAATPSELPVVHR